jgi:hypothetical protein
MAGLMRDGTSHEIGGNRVEEGRTNLFGHPFLRRPITSRQFGTLRKKWVEMSVGGAGKKVDGEPIRTSALSPSFLNSWINVRAAEKASEEKRDKTEQAVYEAVQ